MVNIALVVGRFQPFHLGHLYLIQKAFEYADKIIIAVGSSNIQNEDNPLSFQTRAKMLKKVIAKEGWGERVIKIVPSPDHPSDKVWFDLLFKKTGPFDVKVGRHNDTTNIAIEKAGYKILKVPYYKRDIYQGVFIRELFRKNGKWETRVPPYLVDFISREFSKRL